MLSLFKLSLIAFVLVISTSRVFSAESQTGTHPSVPRFPIGRCVLTQNISSPEDAKAVGFDYLELNLPELLQLSDADFARSVTRLRGVGIPLLSGYGFMPAELKLVGPAIDQPQIDEQLRRALDRAQQLGLTMVIHGNLISGARSAPTGFPIDQAHQQFVEFCRNAAREGAARGITVLIQPVSPNASNLINTVAEGLALVEEVNSPHLQLMVDFETLFNSKEDFSILHKAASHIRQIEIQNPHGRLYPLSRDEADYIGFFRALKVGGYRGGFSIHGKPGDFWLNAPKAISLLRSLAADELVDATAK